MFTFIAAALLQVSSLAGAPPTYTFDEEVQLVTDVLISGKDALDKDKAHDLAVNIVKQANADGGLGGWGNDIVKYLTTDGGLGGWGNDFFKAHTEKAQQAADILVDGGLGGWGND